MYVLPNYGIMDLCTVGYSDFPIYRPLSKMFVKKVLTKKCQKNTEFYADIKSVEIIGKSVPRNNYWPKYKLVV